MNNFVKLSDLCTKITDGSHYSPEGVDTGYPMFSVKDMRDRGFSYDDCKFINETEYQNMVANGCVPQKNDVLIAKDGSYLKHVFVITENKEEAVLSSIGILRPDMTKVNPYYIKYYLSSEFVKKQVKKKYVSGSALPRIILKNFENIEIPYVGLDIQNKIVSVLKSFDDKITNNENINAELESLAKTIYDYWFLQFEFPNEKGLPYKSSGGKMVWSEELKREIPEGWGVGRLPDFCDISTGRLDANAAVASGQYPFFTCAPEASWIDTFAFESDAILLAGNNAGGIFHCQRYCGKFNAYQRTYVLTSTNEWNINYIYHSLLHELDHLKKTSQGSQTKFLTMRLLNDFKVLRYPHSKLSKSLSIFTKIYEMILCKREENRELAALRDWLLPMLMNGQVGFKEQER